MIRINLLPHREEKRKAQRQQFYALLGLLAVVAGVLWFAGATVIDEYISNQENKNLFIRNEITNLDKEIADIAKLKQDTDALIKRKQVIETLQGNRARTAMIFSEILHRIPDGVKLNSFVESGIEATKQFDLLGDSVSEARVSTLMRNLEDSPLFKQVSPIEIRANGSTPSGQPVYSFQMKMQYEGTTEATSPKAAGGPR